MIFSFLTTLLFFTISSEVLASEGDEIDQPFSPPETVEGYLTSDTGDVIPVTGKLVDEPQEFSPFSLSSISTETDLESNSAEYEFEIYSTRTGNNLVTQSDGSLAVRVNLRIYYTESTSGIRRGRIDRVNGTWTRSDSTVSVTNRTLTVGSTGPTSGSPGFVTQRRTFNNVPSSFNYTTSFSTLVHELQGDAGANLLLTLSRGTRTWNLRVTNNLF